MSKYILDIGSKWQSNAKCQLCSAIDNQYKYVIEMAKKIATSELPEETYVYWKQQVDILEGMVVNGYHIPSVYEESLTPHKFVDKNIRETPTYSDDIVNYVIKKYGDKDNVTANDYDEYERRKPTLYFSRWCRDCGARKPDIYDTLQLMKFDVTLNAVVNSDKHSVTVSWDLIDYPFVYSVKLYKKADNTLIDENTDKEGYKFVSELTISNARTISTYIDNEIADGRAYYYKICFVDEHGDVFLERKCDVWNDVWFSHTPKLLRNLKYITHRRLIKNDKGALVRDDYIYARYDVDKNDKDFGDVIFKLNTDHVPSVDYFIDDLQLINNEPFRFPNDKIKYFIKPYIRSRLFKKDWDNDHKIYPDLYYWNTDMQAEIIKYKPFAEDMYDLRFTAGYRSMKIQYRIKRRNNLKFVRIMFKQAKEYITDDNDETCKIIDVPCETAVFDFEINIEGLASNSYWVFGVFPVYDDTDADIRLEYQTIEKIRPWFAEDEWFRHDLDFYYTGYWYWNHDFDKYNLPGIDKVQRANCRDKEVIMCDGLKCKDVAPLLIHRDGCSEEFTLEFDFKMIAKTQKDRMHSYVNHKRQLKVVDSDDIWMHYKETFYNQEFFILRWEQMKMSYSLWTCTFVDNIHVHNRTMIDDKTDNFTREDSVEYTNYRYYNRRIKHNNFYLHTPDKFYKVLVKMNNYIYENDADSDKNGVLDINEEILVGKPDENFGWMP